MLQREVFEGHAALSAKDLNMGVPLVGTPMSRVEEAAGRKVAHVRLELSEQDWSGAMREIAGSRDKVALRQIYDACRTGKLEVGHSVRGTLYFDQSQVARAAAKRLEELGESVPVPRGVPAER